jgi:hypothetical protein
VSILHDEMNASQTTTSKPNRNAMNHAERRKSVKKHCNRSTQPRLQPLRQPARRRGRCRTLARRAARSIGIGVDVVGHPVELLVIEERAPEPVDVHEAHIARLPTQSRGRARRIEAVVCGARQRRARRRCRSAARRGRGALCARRVRRGGIRVSVWRGVPDDEDRDRQCDGEEAGRGCRGAQRRPRCTDGIVMM